MKTLFNLCDRLVFLVECAAGAMLVLMSASTTWQVIGRYVLKKATVWTGDLSLFLFVWVVMLGSAAAIYKRKHIAVTLLVSYLPQAVRYPIMVFSELITIACAALLTATGYTFFTMNISNVSSGLPISLGWPTVSLLFGGALMLLFSIAALCKTLTEGRKAA